MGGQGTCVRSLGAEIGPGLAPGSLMPCPHPWDSDPSPRMDSTCLGVFIAFMGHQNNMWQKQPNMAGRRVGVTFPSQRLLQRWCPGLDQGVGRSQDREFGDQFWVWPRPLTGHPKGCDIECACQGPACTLQYPGGPYTTEVGKRKSKGFGWPQAWVWNTSSPPPTWLNDFTRQSLSYPPLTPSSVPPRPGSS